MNESFLDLLFLVLKLEHIRYEKVPIVTTASVCAFNLYEILKYSEIGYIALSSHLVIFSAMYAIVSYL